MERIFNMDNKFFTFMGRVADLIILNLLFLLCCIPIVTIGPAITAMYYVTMKMVRNEEAYIARSFFKSFKENFKQGLGIWLIALVLIILEFMDFIIMKQLSGGIYTVVKYGLLVIALIMVMILQYVFPLLAKFVNTVKNTIRNALLMSLRHLPYTILMLLISIAPIVAMLFNTMIFSYGILAYFLLGFSTLAFAKSYFFVKIFDKYIPKDESEEEEKDEDDWTIEGLREELEGSTEGTDSEETVSDETAAPADEKPENDDTTEQ